MRVALIATFLNEAASMPAFLASLSAQTRQPDEIVLVDAGSSDGSDLLAEAHPSVRLLRVVGNRSVGRNAAIKATEADVIAATDLGCVLEPTWLERIVQPLEADPTLDVVMGWMVPPPDGNRVRASVATLVVPIESVDPSSTRPSTRSVAFRRASITGHPFPEQLEIAEDAFWFIELRKAGKRFDFAPEARVVWCAPDGPLQLFRVVERYGRWDGRAGLDLKAYGKVAGEFGCMAGLALLALRSWSARLSLAAGLGYYAYRWRQRAVSTLGKPSTFQALVRVPSYGMVAKAAQISGYARGTIERLRTQTRERREKNVSRPSAAER